MRVTLDIEQGTWMQLLTRAYEESLDPSEVVSAWLRRALRQRSSLMPGVEERSKVVEMRRDS